MYKSLLITEEHFKGLFAGVPFDFCPSSKQCSVPTCLHILPELPLQVRSWVCPECGSQHDRDLNAARNIYRVGISTREGKAVRPVLSGRLC
ncbi:MAG: transposase [Desulfobulbus sp.]|nr:transposase [Desulfobulbus sp.]